MRRIETVDRKVLFLLALLRVPVKKKTIFRMVHFLQKRGVGFGIEVKKIGNSYISPQLEEILSKLVDLGYLEKLYTLDLSTYGGLYIEVYVPTPKADRILQNPKFSKKDQKIIADFVNMIKTKFGKKKVSVSGASHETKKES